MNDIKQLQHFKILSCHLYNFNR